MGWMICAVKIVGSLSNTRRIDAEGNESSVCCNDEGGLF